ncbi:DUF4652 domain-containing protein [Clostridium algidicarnis]|uniref:DUF4652 domain-containing protein n=1 Tax=Clostridium algidicarnis TaxID=37659 RepID=UPI0016299C10|nr:DUF4652 domain-containing protein [Clostridium algidicarnis]MBB6698125.1 DUF4652 domain-containing protein [Clostridium algidicarnis]
MKCDVFRKKIYDYIEDNLQNDMKISMEEHINKCPNCRDIYEKEMGIENTLKDSLDVNTNMFTNLRGDIVASIDKSRYSKSIPKKIKFHFFRNSKRYITLAVFAFVFLMSVPYLNRNTFNKDESLKMAIVDPKEDLNKDLKLKSENLGNKGMDISNEENRSSAEDRNTVVLEINKDEYKAISKRLADETYDKSEIIPLFTKETISYDYKPQDSTPWISSFNMDTSICIEGKGSYYLKDKSGSIIVRDNAKNEAWKISLEGKEKDKNYPMYLEWADDKNIFVIVGIENHDISPGGNLYSINLDTMKASLVYNPTANKEKITSVENNKDSLELKTISFNDDLKQEYHEEKRTINYKEVTNSKENSVTLLYDFSRNINEGNKDAALNLFEKNFKQEYKNYIGDIKDINKLNINRIVDVTDASLGKNNKYDFKVYGVMSDYEINTSADTKLKSSTYYNYFVLIKQKTDKNWSILQILTPPQN